MQASTDAVGYLVLEKNKYLLYTNVSMEYDS